jgi:hypothetical protein
VAAYARPSTCSIGSPRRIAPTIGDLTQPVLERWLAEGSTRTKREVAPFLAWTAARRITPKLTVARQRNDVPSRFLDEQQHFDLLKRCLTDETMPLAVRVAGALILLYGVRVTTVATLTTTDRFTRSNGAYISLGGTPALLPPNLARLLDQLAEQLRRFGAAVAHMPHYLLPSRIPTRPA